MEAALVARLEKAVERLEKFGEPSGSVRLAAAVPAAPAPAPAVATASGSSAVAEWDHLIAEHFAPIKALVPSLPQEVQQGTASFEKALQAARRVLEVAAVAKKPEGPSELGPLLAPVGEAMGAVTAAAEARRLQCVQQLKMLAEAVAGLGFLAYTGPGCGMSPPRQHVSESWGSAEFFANKTLMEFRGKDEAQVAWVRGVKSFMQQLEQFVVRNCATGLRFDPNGQPLAAAMRGGGGGATAAAAAPPAAAPPRKAGGPPPPPPGPPPKPLSATELGLAPASAGRGAAGPAAGEGGASALFAQLSKGEGITSGLRKVTDDMKAKNRADRSGAVPGAAGAAAGGSAPAAGGARGAKGPRAPPKLELQGAKWVVENHEGRGDLVVVNEAPKNSVYIYGCRDCTIKVEGKVNGITLDGCSKVGVVFGDVIAVTQAVNCSSIQLQVTGSVPMLSVEKTDGAQLYVSRKCAADPNFQVVTAKCSAVNVVVVPEPEEAEAEGEAADPVEHPVPEQFISTFTAEGKLVTVAAAHSGA